MSNPNIKEPQGGEFTPDQIREKLLKAIPAGGKPVVCGDLLYKRETRKIFEADLWEEIRRMKADGLVDFDGSGFRVWRVRK